jgi:hypothetical protein
MNTTSTSPPPEWIDAKVAKQIFGVGKTTLYNLAAAGKIKTSSLRLPGDIRGKRLFSYDSIKRLIEANATGDDAANPEGKGGAG